MTPDILAVIGGFIMVIGMVMAWRADRWERKAIRLSNERSRKA
jgi:hypothetical protein